MALQKPIVNTIAAFDATSAHTINFVVSGGDQVTANRAIIKLGSTNEVLYDATQTTFALQHTIPANTLTNGNYYIIQIQTLNSDSDTSALSSPITFYCYSTPTFNFSNLPTSNVVQNVSYNFTLSYNQNEGESLSSYVVDVYSLSQSLIWSSDVVYVGANGVPPTSFSIPVSGFEDSSAYYIRARGQTEQLTELDTGYILLTTTFDARSIYTQLLLTNNSCEGYIMITSNVVSLDGVTNPEEPIYINDQEIDLRETDSYVTWEQSFGIYGTYTARLWLRDINPDSIVATIYNANNPAENIILYEREETISGTTYLYIEAYYTDASGVIGYIYTDSIEKPADSDSMMIWVQKRNGLYDLSIEEVE